MNDHFDLVQALKEVPECRLRLLEIAREVLNEKGVLDTDLAANRSKEIAEASEEAEAYAKETHDAVQDLYVLKEGT